MKKIKKVLVSFTTLFFGGVLKVFAATFVDPATIKTNSEKIETVYGVNGYEQTRKEILIPIILFFIGLFVVLNKKINNKVKVIVVSVLVILAILGVILIRSIY